MNKIDNSHLDFPELEGNTVVLFQSWNHKNIDLIVAGCCYDIGITLVLAHDEAVDNKGEVIACIRFEDIKLMNIPEAQYKKDFLNLIDLIKRKNFTSDELQKIFHTEGSTTKVEQDYCPYAR